MSAGQAWQGNVKARLYERAFARQVLAATGFELLYAQVDVARDERGAPRLMELELTEPNLFLRQGGPRVVECLAEAIAHKAGGRA